MKKIIFYSFLIFNLFRIIEIKAQHERLPILNDSILYEIFIPHFKLSYKNNFELNKDTILINTLPNNFILNVYNYKYFGNFKYYNIKTNVHYNYSEIEYLFNKDTFKEYTRPIEIINLQKNKSGILKYKLNKSTYKKFINKMKADTTIYLLDTNRLNKITPFKYVNMKPSKELYKYKIFCFSKPIYLKKNLIVIFCCYNSCNFFAVYELKKINNQTMYNLLDENYFNVLRNY